MTLRDAFILGMVVGALIACVGFTIVGLSQEGHAYAEAKAQKAWTPVPLDAGWETKTFPRWEDLPEAVAWAQGRMAQLSM